MRQAMAEAERGEQGRRARIRGVAFCTVDQLRQNDVLDRVEIGQQMVELVDEAKAVTAHERAAMRVELRGFGARDADRSLEPAFEQTDRLQQRRFARSRRAEQRDDFPRRDRQIDPAQHLDRLAALREAARKPGGVQDGITHT